LEKNEKNNKQPDKIDIGNETVESLRNQLNKEKNIVECPGCKKQIDKNSQFCKFCGYDFSSTPVEEKKNDFEEEYEHRYKDNLRLKRITIGLTSFSLLILALFFGVTIYLSITSLVTYLSSDNGKIKDIIFDWNKAYNKRNTDLIKEHLDKDFIFYDSDGKEMNADKRLKSLKDFFKNKKYKKVILRQVEITPDSSSIEYRFVNIEQVFIYENEQRGLKKTFKFYKGEQSNNKWKIFREYYNNE
jgi:hypothetical protein